MLSFMNNLKISTRIIVLSAAPIVGLALLGLVYFDGEKKISEAFEVASGFDDVKASFDAIDRGVLSMSSEVNQFLQLRNEQSRSEFEASAKEATDAIAEASAHEVGPEISGDVAQVTRGVPALIAEFHKVIQARTNLGLNNGDGILGALHRSVRE